MKIIIEYRVDRKNSTTHVVETVQCKNEDDVVDAVRDAFMLIASYDDPIGSEESGHLIKIQIVQD